MVLLFHSHDAVTSLVDFYGFRDKGSMNLKYWSDTSIKESTGR